MVYYGPANEARGYFEDMGYQPANRQSTADFLVAVTDDLGRIVKKGYEQRVPRTPDEMAEYFMKSEFSRRNREDIAGFMAEMGHAVPRSISADSENADGQMLNMTSNRSSLSNVTDEKQKRTSQYVQSARAERAKHTRPGSPYTISVPMQVRAVILRRVQIMKGDLTAQVIQIMYAQSLALVSVKLFADLKYPARLFSKLSLWARFSSISLSQRRHIFLVVVFCSCTFFFQLYMRIW